MNVQEAVEYWFGSTGLTMSNGLSIMAFWSLVKFSYTFDHTMRMQRNLMHIHWKSIGNYITSILLYKPQVYCKYKYAKTSPKSTSKRALNVLLSWHIVWNTVFFSKGDSVYFVFVITSSTRQLISNYIFYEGNSCCSQLQACVLRKVSTSLGDSFLSGCDCCLRLPPLSTARERAECKSVCDRIVV